MTAITAARHFFDDPAERRAYFAEEIRRMDEQSIIEGNRREAKEGLAEGLVKGRTEERESLVLNVLKNMPNLKNVASLLNVSLAEVQRIAVKYGIHA